MIDELKQWEYDKGYTQGREDAIEKCIYWLETHCMANNFKGIPKEDIRGVLETLKEQNEQ